MTNNAGGRFKLVSPSNKRDASTGYRVVVADTARINALATPTLSITLRVDDGTFDNSFTVSITVDPRPIVPVMPATSVSEDSPIGFKVATVSLSGLERNDVTPIFAIAGADKSYFALAADLSGKTASLTLVKSVSGYRGNPLAFDILVSFVNDALPAVQKSFTLAVTAVNQAPVFGAYPTVYVRDDTPVQSVLVTVNAVDPEGSPITYALADSFAGFLAIDSTTGAISSTFVPSQSHAMSLGDYTAMVTATDGIATTRLMLTFSIVDDCFVIPTDPNAVTPCSGLGVCVDGVATYTCNCDPGYTGTDCQDLDLGNNGNSNASSATLGGGAVAGIIIGCIVGILLILIVLLVLARRRGQKAGHKQLTDVDAEAQAAVFNNGFIKEDTYDVPTHVAVETDFEPGVANPMYAWYQPNMSRQECEEYLATQGEGAFVIRDSSFTPGWHMLGVKTGNQIVHERIKLNQDGTYELLPSAGMHQPNFPVLPDLVSHYAAVKREGIPFSLALDNPIYDNHLLQEAPRAAVQVQTLSDPDAPELPAHEFSADA